MPRCGRRWLGTRVMSRPKSVMEPASGESSPVMRLKSVVLPSPFGPMIRRRSPGSTVRSTASVTRRPPNDFWSFCTESAAMVGGRDYRASRRRCRTGASCAHRSPVGQNRMTDDELTYLTVLFIVRALTAGVRAPNSRAVGLGGPDGTHTTRSSSLGNRARRWRGAVERRSEEHTSELQSHSDLVCRLLL